MTDFPSPSIPPPSSDAAAEQAAPEPLTSLVFTDVAHGAREILIEHHGQVYRLRLTRNDKLILSK